MIKNPQIALAVHLASLVLCTVLITNLYFTLGIGPAWILLVVVALFLLISLMARFSRQDRQVIQVMRALANGDSTLGYSSDHPMRNYFEQVKQQMQLARFNAEQQSDFLKALLVHVDLAVLVFDEQGKVIESNPAVAKLLGKKVTQLEQMNHIATLIRSADKNFHSTVQWQHGEQEDTLTLQVSLAQIQGQERKIVTLQSIHEVLLNKEQQAYKRLTRVLTHEVANTITPLASIAETCQGLMPSGLSFDDEDDKQDLSLALKTLASRTEYLGEFIESFRQVSSLPMPTLMPSKLEDILERTSLLYRQQLQQQQINLTIDIGVKQLVMIDCAQIEQVVINLVKNAIEAVQGPANQQNDKVQLGEIKLAIAQNSAQQLYLEVADNGTGITDSAIDMIFVPFFTTKQAGSGIGLSLSRQIMVNHGGDLVYVKRSQGACFRCIFG